MDIRVINLEEKLSSFDTYWDPHIIGELNGQHVKLAKLKGEFVWHSHEKEDELFLVVKGKLKIVLRDKVLELREGEMVIIPKGVEHKPIAEEEVQVLLFEPVSTINTGDVQHADLTKSQLKKI
ncbi:MAG: cupin domain-containing protein [Flavipsychrobacter sp.]